MDPLLWDAIQSLRSGRNQQSVDNNSIYKASMTDSNQDSYCEYSGYTGKPQSSASGSEEWEGPRSTSYEFYNQESEPEDPDGESLVIDDEDPELARKRKELKAIEERIKLKKVSIALKTVEHIVKNVPEAPSTNGESCVHEGQTLKERVGRILQQCHSDSFLSKVHTDPKGRLKSSSLSKLQGDHPLKLKVKKLMRQRSDDPFVFSTYGQVPDITPPPPAQRETSAEKEAKSIDLGFQRFLSILNKGVDIEMLNKIVSADGEDLPVEDPDIQPPALEDTLELPLRNKRRGEDPPLRSESQGSSSGASVPRHSRTSSGERKTNLQSLDRSLSERFSLPSDEEERTDRGDRCLLSSGASVRSHSPTSSRERKIDLHSQERSLSQKQSLHEDEVKNNKVERCLASSSRSRSPPALKKKKKREKTPKVDDQREQLQNILQTLGLSLAVEEMSKLTDRTQERLYGKKKTESREEQESQQKSPRKHSRNSSSSSSPSSSSSSSSSPSSSGSASRSSSPSPSRHQASRRRASNERRTSERSRSRDRRRDKPSNRDSKQDSERALRHKHRDDEHAKETFTHENPDSHQPIPTCSAHHPAGFPQYADYSFPQYSQYEHYQNTFNGATNSYWMDSQNSYPASFYPSDYSHLHQNPIHHFSHTSAALRKVPNRRKVPAQDFSFLVNPDLSTSEGQVGPASGSRCLRVVSTLQTTSQRCVTTLAVNQKMRKGGNKKKKKKKSKKRPLCLKEDRQKAKPVKLAPKKELVELKEAAERKEVAKEKEATLHHNKDDSESEKSEEEKQAPTEEEIKKNLRKMLAAFNQKPKTNVIQPPTYVSCENE